VKSPWATYLINTFVFKGANKVFSPFGKPRGLKAKYVFIRLGISKESLLQGISTPIELVYETIDRLHSYKSATKLRVTNTAGTNITLSINAFTTCEHRIVEDGGMAFLPPSETSSEVIAKTSNGKIVVDVTIGQLYHYGNLIGYFGLVASPVTLIVDNGMITDIIGEDMATELKEKLFALPEDCRTLVELGHGLSKMTPTGLIGVDESIIDTCHFGIGDGASCGVHLDVVISNPTIEEV
jgi:leucyl aminopeptidase (aminopeptidase T)